MKYFVRTIVTIWSDHIAKVPLKYFNEWSDNSRVNITINTNDNKPYITKTFCKIYSQGNNSTHYTKNA